MNWVKWVRWFLEAPSLWPQHNQTAKGYPPEVHLVQEVKPKLPNATRGSGRVAGWCQWHCLLVLTAAGNTATLAGEGPSSSRQCDGNWMCEHGFCGDSNALQLFHLGSSDGPDFCMGGWNVHCSLPSSEIGDWRGSGILSLLTPFFVS